MSSPLRPALATARAALLIVGVALAGCGNGSTGANASADLAGSNLLAPPGAATAAGPVNGIRCDLSEMLAFHIHAHLAVFVDGGPKYLPAGIGIGPPLLYTSGGAVAAGACFSWLHTHDESGVIHIESPVQRVFTLGDFFAVWGQPLSASAVGPVSGPVAATLNGQPVTTDVTAIPLDAHNVVQLNVRSPTIPFQPYPFPEGL